MAGARALKTVVVLAALLASLAPDAIAAGKSIRPTPGEVQSLLDRGEYADAEHTSRAALASLESLGLGDSLEAADQLDLLVAALHKLAKSRGAEARERAERAVAIRTRLQGADHPDTATSMLALARVLRVQRDFSGAQSLCERATAIRERAFGSDSSEYAESVNELGNLLYEAGNPAMAMPLYQRVLDIRERTLGPDHPDTADVLGNLGSAQRRLGDAAAAQSSYERALSIFEHAFGPNHLKVANTLNNLAITLKNAGEWAGARRDLERALPIYELEFGRDHPYVAGLLNNLADLALKVGDHGEARRLLERSLEIREHTLGPSHTDVAQALNNLANVIKEQGDLTRARPLLERSVAIREKALGATHPDLALSLNNLGELLCELRDYPAARTAHTRALAIRERALGPDHPSVAESLHNLALVSLAQRELDDARAQAKRALDIYVRVYGEAHPTSAQAAATFARMCLVAGDRAAALEAALRAEDWARAHLQFAASRLSEREALSYADIRTNGRDLALSIVVTGASTKEQRTRVWEAVARARGVVLESLLARRLSLAASDSPELAALHEEMTRAAEEYARLVVAGQGTGPDEESRQRIDAARRRRERAERELVAHSPAFGRSVARRELTVDKVSAALPAGSVLVSFVRYNHEEAGPRSGAVLTTVARYLALVLKADSSDVAIVQLGDAAGLEERVRSWATEAARGALVQGRTPTEALVAYRQAGRNLRRAAWDPLRRALGRPRLLLVVPDGALHRVSWSALPSGRDAYLVESGPTIQMVTAEREVLLFDGQPEPGSGLLAVGGPDYDAPPGQLSRDVAGATATSETTDPEVDAGTRFGPLPETAREIEVIAAIWRTGAARHADARGRQTAAGRGDVVTLSGATASEAAVTSLAAGRRVVHIATHALLLTQPVGQSGTTMRGLGGLAPTGAAPALAAMEERMGTAGLALAGANRRDSRGAEDDGVLTTGEIGLLDLSAAEWAVLSACETGTGQLHGSEGVLGLQRAFREAGARSVIVSLWAVDDRATREWMAALYRARFEDGLATAEAARRAARRLLSAYRAARTSHPFSWGAFVATGDWN